MSDNNEIHEVEEFLQPEPDQPIPWRLLFVAILAIGLAVFILQNFEEVQLDFLWLEFRMPEAVVILLTALVSAFLTWSAIAISRRRKRKREPQSPVSE